MGEMISVIVPVYNVAAYLGECIDSILAQTYRELEIILVDDGSMDGSGEICDEYAAKDARVRVIHQENRGVSAAREDNVSDERVPFISVSTTPGETQLTVMPEGPSSLASALVSAMTPPLAAL